MFRRRTDERRPAVGILVDGVRVSARAGDSVAAAMLAAGHPVARRTALSGSPRATAELGLAYSLQGNAPEARRLIDELAREAKERYVSPFDFAVIYGGLGDTERTMEWLQRAERERSPSLNYLILSPAFTSVRSDPRFTAFVRHVGLGPAD